MDLPFDKTILENPRFKSLGILLLCLLGLGILFYSGNQMLQLKLWGYLPLAFFFACWLLLNLAFHFVYKSTQSTAYWLLSSLSGLMFHLSFPDPSATPLIFLAFLPLLFIAEREKDKPKGAWRVFRYSYSAFLLWNILTTFWVANTSFIPSVVAFSLNSLFMTIPFMLYFHFRKRFSLVTSLLAFAAFWVSFEMIHLRWEISWPWLTLGNAFSSRSLWIQWYEYTGHIGGSVWVLLVNALLFYIGLQIQSKKQLLVSHMLLPMLALMAPIIISFFIFFGYQEKGEIVNVTAVQPNFEPHYEKFDVAESIQRERFLKIVKANISDSTDYVVFPETSFGYYDLDKLEERKTIQMLSKALDSFPSARLVTGLASIQNFDGPRADIINVREIESPTGTRYLQVQNSAIELKGLEDSISIHIKGKLVPGAEIFPYSKALFFVEPIVKLSGGTTKGLGRSRTPTVFGNGKAIVAPAICYESIYGYWMRKFVNEGADLIFVVTNDGWWDNTPGHRQHLSFAILRAIELRKSVVRSANTGVSCFIDQHGRVFQPLAYGTEGAINGQVRSNPEVTFYARNGDLLGRIAYLLSLVFIVFMFRQRFKDKSS